MKAQNKPLSRSVVTAVVLIVTLVCTVFCTWLGIKEVTCLITYPFVGYIF